ncbi:unnamed protein product, partial [Discosporangium mesarthrocarpum]
WQQGDGGVRAILRAVKNASALPSALCDQLLHLLPMVEDPAPLVSAIPHLVADGGPEEVGRVVQEYRRLLNEDRAMLVHVVGSLHDLPIGKTTRREVSDMTLEALSMVDEEDLPVIVRTLLKNMGDADGAQVVGRIREECSGCSPTTQAVLLEVLANAFPVNEAFTHAFLSSLATLVSSDFGE